MTTKERITRMYEHREADRVPILDSPWNSTIKRWQREGMPPGDYRDHFGLDKIQRISVDVSPQYEYKVIEETDDYIITTSNFGVTMKNFKEEESAPEFLDFTYNTSEMWPECKSRATVSDDRIPWKYLEENYETWVENGDWIEAFLWFGFDVTHSWMVGTETMLIAMMVEQDWVKDMFHHFLENNIAMYERLWDKGYRFDSVFWYDDMGYKNTTFFSPKTYRELLKPYHKRAVDWAHKKGCKAHLHSCGDIMAFLDDLVEIGVDALNPLEVKAGMRPLEIKEKYGNKLVLHGGINAVLWNDKEAILQQIQEYLPKLKENGGYIFSSDHSIPNTVSYENFTAIINTVKEFGRY